MKEDIVDVLNMFFDYRIENIHTIIPGKILSYDESKRLAEVEPRIQLKTTKEVYVKYPVLENVPVMFPSGKVFSLRWDIEKNDGCLIVFSEASLGNFLNATSDDQIECEDSSRFSLTDAICIPGLHTIQKAKSLSKDVEIYIDKNGKITIKSKDCAILIENDTTIDTKTANIKSSSDTIIDATGNAEINGTIVKLNGDTKAFVTHAELNNAITTFLLALNGHIHTAPSGGGSTTPPITPMTFDISAAQTTTVKTGG